MRERSKNGWLGIKMMCSGGATCLWWRSVLLLEETGELEENHRPVASSCKSNANKTGHHVIAEILLALNTKIHSFLIIGYPKAK
jgi:hypothetical protein